MKNNNFLWFTLLILVTGCGQAGQQSGTADSWHTGVKGLEMNFMEGAPPKILYNEGGPYTGVLELWNKGTTKISTGNVYFSGFDTGIITGITSPAIIPGDLEPEETIETIEAITQYNHEGGYATMKEEAVNVIYAFPTGVLNTKIKATALYPYETEFSTDVCVDLKPYAQTEKVCNMAEKSVSGGQGAPVAVTGIVPQAMVDVIKYKVSIKNAGNGKVIKKSSVNTAPSDLTIGDYDTVNVKGKPKLGNLEGSCLPIEVRLVNGNGFTFCTFSEAPKEAYVTRLDLKLEYGYMSSTEIGVEVRGTQ